MTRTMRRIEAPDPSSGSRLTSRRLIAMADELYALARGMEAEGPGPDGDEEGERAFDFDHPRLGRIARHIYEQRRRRSEYFNSDLFGEAAWDLLLDLYVAGKERKRLSVTSACIGADVPSTTALRWIRILEEEGLVTREADEEDARRVFIRLTQDGVRRMSRYMRETALGLDVNIETP